jgi:hypothetical protein
VVEPAVMVFHESNKNLIALGITTLTNSIKSFFFKGFSYPKYDKKLFEHIDIVCRPNNYDDFIKYIEEFLTFGKMNVKIHTLDTPLENPIHISYDLNLTREKPSYEIKLETL